MKINGRSISVSACVLLFSASWPAAAQTDCPAPTAAPPPEGTALRYDVPGCPPYWNLAEAEAALRSVRNHGDLLEFESLLPSGLSTVRLYRIRSVAPELVTDWGWTYAPSGSHLFPAATEGGAYDDCRVGCSSGTAASLLLGYYRKHFMGDGKSWCSVDKVEMSALPSDAVPAVVPFVWRYAGSQYFPDGSNENIRAGGEFKSDRDTTYYTISGTTGLGPKCSDGVRPSSQRWVQSQVRHFVCPKPYRAELGTVVYETMCDNPQTAQISVTPVEQTCCGDDFGNPVNASIGRKHQIETDYVGTLGFTRYYQSIQQTDPRYGIAPGWTHSYSSHLLTVSGNPPNFVARPNGLFVRLTPQIQPDNSTRYVSIAGDISVRRNGSQWELTHNSGVREIYALDGRLLSLSDAAGQLTALIYTGTGVDGKRNTRLAAVQGPQGHRLEFRYDDHDRLVELVTPDGPISYGYEPDPASISDLNNSARLVSVLHADGTERRYHYEDPRFRNHLTGITDERGERINRYTYDEYGRVAVSERGDSQEHQTVAFRPTSGTAMVTDPGDGLERYTLAFRSDGAAVVTDPQGESKVYRYGKFSGNRRLLTAVEHNGKTRSMKRDTQGRVTSETDEEGRKTTFDYSGVHLIRKTEAAGTPEARVIRYEYNTAGQITLEETASVTAGQFHRQETSYTANLPSEITERGYTPDGSPVVRTTVNGYDAEDRLVSVDGPRTDVADVTVHEYEECAAGSPCRELRRVINPLGQVTTYERYDASGRPLQMTGPDGTRISMEYDTGGRLIRRTIGAATTGFEYDAAGRLQKAIQPAGDAVHYSYDASGLLTEIADAAGNRIAYGYDSKRRRVSERTYSPAGALTRELTQAYDLFDHVSRINRGGAVTELVYDAVGQLRSENQAGATTTHAYDARGRRTLTTDAASGETRYEYDAQDNLVKVTDPRGLSTRYVYDDLGNLLQQTSPDTGITTHTYDAAGNRTSQTDARGVTVTYSYDVLNRITLADYPEEAEDVRYFYDGSNYGSVLSSGIGRLTGIQDQSGTTVLVYDARGNVIEERRTAGSADYVTTYHYDLSDRVSEMTYPTGRTVRYERNASGELHRITTADEDQIAMLAEEIEYQPFGPVRQYSLGNGLESSREHDLGYRTTQIRAAGSVQNLTLRYDARENITAIEDGIAARSQSFDYDALSRLTSAEGVYGSQAFTYDSVGNRLVETVIPAQAGIQSSRTYAYAADSHRLLSIGGSDPSSFAYDPAGNAIQKDDLSLGYNQANRLTLASRGGTMVTNTYNASGQRITKTVDGQVTLFHYDRAGHLIAETDGAGEVLREYVWLDDQPIALLTPVIPDPPEQVLDNPQAELVGKWHRVLQPSGFEGLDCMRHPKAPPKQASATWKPVLTKPAKYEVFAKWSAHPDRATDAPYTIHHKDGQATIRVNQTKDGSQWVSLGTYTLGPGHKVVLENSANGQVIADAIRIVRISGGNVTGTHYFHTDHLGTPQAITDQDQAVVWKAAYEPFGNVNLLTEEIQNPLRLPGQYFDQETSLHQNWFRDYDPQLGRYLQSDPIGLDGGINTYGYANQNPLRFTDPTGLVTWTGSQTGGQFLTAGSYYFTLKSECINNKRAWAKVLAIGPGAGFGAEISATHESTKFEDGSSTPNPSVFNGIFLYAGAGIAIPPSSSSTLGLMAATGRPPGPYGVSAGAIQLGGARSIGAGGTYGLDLSVGFLIGSSTVVDSGVEDCCE